MPGTETVHNNINTSKLHNFDLMNDILYYQRTKKSRLKTHTFINSIKQSDQRPRRYQAFRFSF